MKRLSWQWECNKCPVKSNKSRMPTASIYTVMMRCLSMNASWVSYDCDKRDSTCRCKALWLAVVLCTVATNQLILSALITHWSKCEINIWIHISVTKHFSWGILKQFTIHHGCKCACLRAHCCTWQCVLTVRASEIWNPSRNLGEGDGVVIFHHLSFYWFVYKNSQTCCPRALLLPSTLLVCSLGHPELSRGRQKTNHFPQTTVTTQTDNTVTTVAIN